VRNNTAEDGSGIANEDSELVLTDSTVRNNEAYYDGGGILNEGTTRIARSTIHDNVARYGDGGGIHNEESLEIHASTLSGNYAGDNGGGISNQFGSLVLSSSTLTHNEAWRSGGLHNRGAAGLDHNLIAGNFYDFAENPSDCNEWSGYPITSLGHNLVGAVDDCPSIDHATDLKGTLAVVVDPGLEPLGFYGGPTETHALVPGSPAIDAGAAAGCGPVDQRGQARPADGNDDTLPLCDIGAFEVVPSACSDPARTIEATPGCRAQGIDTAACTQAFQISGMGEAESCFVASDGSCEACTADRQAVGLCANTCNAICEDLSRWNNAGVSADDGPCTLYHDDSATCEATFYVGPQSVPVSCFYDTEYGDCLGCTTELREEALCRNECLPAACVDPGRPLEVVDCVDLGADDFFCEAAYEIGPSGDARTCFAGSDGLCSACEDLDQARGDCTNTCVALPCADSSLTVNAGTEAYGGCTQLDGDPATCGSAFQTIYDGSFESCYDDNGACRGCDPDAEAEELCENTCGSSVCGNGRIFGDETCDDGNSSGGDGCSFICRIEPGWECSGEPSRCFPSTGQTRQQQKCIKDTLSQGVSLAKMQNRVDLACLKDANRGRTDKLAGLGQAATVDACTQNDVRGRIARRISTLVERQQRLCLAAPEQLPDICYAGAATVLATSRAEPVELMHDLLGDVLHDAVLPITRGRDDTICQEHLVRFTQLIFERLWKEALRTIKTSLGDPAVSTPEEVEARVLQYLNEDPRGRIARATTKLVDRLQTRCTGIALANVAPGSCSDAADSNQLAECAEQHARCRVCRALTEAAAITLDCDAFDNQGPGGDGSCP
jgi:cysteine-rich repeat protein